MVVIRNPKPLCDRKALYIGSAVPIQTAKGVDAVQKPLLERYKGDLSEVEGIDCELRVWPDCLEMTYSSSGQIVQFPLINLSVCAAVRCITAVNAATGEKNRQFVPVNIVSSDARHPAIFSVIIRRSQGRQILECHSFICRSNRDALLLVNATGTANMALKKTSGRTAQSSGQYEDGIQVVHMTQQNGYSSAEETPTVERHLNRYGTEYQEPSNQTLFVKTSTEGADQQVSSTNQGVTSVKEDDNTIYISFDKTNLTARGGSTLQVDTRSGEYAGEERVIHASDKSIIVEKPVYVDMPAPVSVPPPQPYVIEAPKYYLRPSPPVPPAPPPVVYQRPVLLPPPRPVVLPAPQPIAYRPPPPVVVRTGVEPVPQRMYTRRVVPQYQRRYLSPQPPVVVRPQYTRSRSASPGYARSEIHVRKDYQPRVTGHASDPGIGEFSHFVPRPYGQPMFVNERAFSRRMNADQRISGLSAPYNHPTAYDLADAMVAEQVTYKSNPKYSSSASSADEKDRDHRYSKRRSRRN